MASVMISLHEGRGSAAKKASPRKAYTLRLTVAAVQPRIWRRLLVRDTMWLSRLHEAIQLAFGWYDYQTHLFIAGEKRYGNPVDHEGLVIEDDRDVTLADLRPGEHGHLSYDYLFGEGWHVDVRVEKTTAVEKGAVYPRCVAGERHGPPEDCGGLEAYKDMLYCLKHPETDLGREWREWLGRAYDPEKCDLNAINRALRRLGR